MSIQSQVTQLATLYQVDEGSVVAALRTGIARRKVSLQTLAVELAGLQTAAMEAAGLTQKNRFQAACRTVWDRRGVDDQ